MEPRYLSVRQCGELFGVEQWTVRRLIREGQLRATRIDRAVVVRRADAERLANELAKRKSTGASVTG